MKRPPRLSRSFLVLSLALAFGARLAALTATEWQTRQAFTVAAPGFVRVAVPATTFDASLPGLADVRITDASGKEVPYYLDAPVQPANERPTLAWLRPKSFNASTTEAGTQLLIETGTNDGIELIELETTAPFFLKAVHVDISSNGQDWKSLGAAIPIFRQFGAEQLQLDLEQENVAFVRVTLDNARSRPVGITGARILRELPASQPPRSFPVGARITRRDEFAGETVLTVTLDGRRVPLDQLHFEIKDALFMRRATVAIREVRGGVAEERILATGTLYRVAIDDTPAHVRLDLSVNQVSPTRDLLVHLYNGDSPPLAIDGVEATQHPVNLLFLASAAGSYQLLTGNAQASAPRYDLAAFGSDLSKAVAGTLVTPGPIEATPDYHAREALSVAPLPDVPLSGAALDTKAWTIRRPVQIARAGIQELELDPSALARARPDFADLRLLHAGNQIPYVLEQPGLARSLSLSPANTPDAKRPAVSVWQLTLPHAGVPVSRLVLTSSTPLFQRQLRIFEKLTDREGGAFEVTLASGAWSRTPEPGVPEARTFELGDRVRTNTLWIETDNGDNPPIVLGPVQAIYPVARLVFKVAETDGFELAYGNKAVSAPRYDLSLVAVKLLTPSRSVAKLAADDSGEAESREFFSTANGRYAFWGVLALVVIVLLVVVAKLLPKPAKK